MDIYLCFQSALEATVCEGYNTCILSICDSEDKAQEVCNHDGDSYQVYNLNEVLSRVMEDTSETSTYNVNGKFIKGWSNTQEEISNEKEER